VVEPAESPEPQEPCESPSTESIEVTEQDEIPTESYAIEDMPVPMDLPRAARKTAPPPPLKPADLTPRKAVVEEKQLLNRTERRPKMRRELTELDRMTDLLDAVQSDDESHQIVITSHAVDADKEKVCWNSRLRRGIKKHLVIGRSEIHGWGCFVAEPVAKGELLSEV
jgi:hypothetical protein